MNYPNNKYSKTMLDVDDWQLKSKSCAYSDKLLIKLLLIDEQSLDKINILEVKKAVHYAKKYHGKQKRDSGDLYYSHPLAVAEMVAEHCFKTDILITSILHDTLEDTTLTKDMIRYIFDDNIANKVDDLTRIKIDRKISSAEMIELLFIQKKEELLLIKYFDRLHNMQTITIKSPEKILKIVKETLKNFIPLGRHLEKSLPRLSKTNQIMLNLCYQALSTLPRHDVKFPFIHKYFIQNPVYKVSD